MKYWTEADALSKRIRKKIIAQPVIVFMQNLITVYINFSSKKKKNCKINNIEISKKKNGIIRN